jgi:DNA polymerase III alpha subunit
MAFAQLEDLQGTIDVVIFSRTWGRTKEYWETGRILIVTGKVDDSRQQLSLICDAVQTDVAEPRETERLLSTVQNSDPEEADWIPPLPQSVTEVRPSGQSSQHQNAPSRIEITFRRSPSREADLQRLGQIYTVLNSYSGPDRFTLRIEANGNAWELSFPNDTTRYCAELERELVELLGLGTVRVEKADRTA